MMSSAVFWVDEEETVAFPDVLDLRLRGHAVEMALHAGEAVDWFFKNRQRLNDFSAFMMDVQLPTNGDSRFNHEVGQNGTFTGLKVCELLKGSLNDSEWQLIKPKTVLYTRLPDNARMAKIRKFADEYGLHFVHKSGQTSLLEHIVNLGLIT